MTRWTRRTYEANQADLAKASPHLIDDGGRVRDLNLDGSTNALTTITYAHHEVHEGSNFIVSDTQNVNATTMKWQVTTPDSEVEPHMVLDVECTGEMYMIVTEGSDRDDGTALAEINRNRRSSKTADVIVTRTPVNGSTDGATTIRTIRSGATGVGSKTVSAGGLRGMNEFLLKRNTKYVVSITTYADVYVSIGFDWYEHKSKE